MTENTFHFDIDVTMIKFDLTSHQLDVTMNKLYLTKHELDVTINESLN